MAEGKQWYYLVGEQRHGPLDEAGVRQLIAQGTVQPGTLVWNAEMSAWAPAGTKPELASFFAPPPPPPVPSNVPPPPPPPSSPPPPAPVAPTARPAPVGAPRSGGGRWLLLLIAGVVGLGVLGAGAFFVYMRLGGSHTALTLAAQAPADSCGVAAVAKPREMIAETVKELDKAFANDPKMRKEWEDARKEGKEDLGFDLADPAAYGPAGFDLSKPVTVALLGWRRANRPGPWRASR